MPGTAAIRPASSTMPLRTVGSPPVNRTLRRPPGGARGAPGPRSPPARSPALWDAQPCEHRDQALELLERQHRGARLEHQLIAEVLGHAIRASVVTAVGDRDT